MFRNKKELMEILKKLIGDNNSDEYISYVEDFNDSIDDENISWKEKYDELDRNWRERYTARFFSGDDGEKDTFVEDKTEPDSVFDERNDITIDDIFKESK